MRYSGKLCSHLAGGQESAACVQLAAELISVR